MGVIVALDKTGAASGELYLDDGESQVPETSLWVKVGLSRACLISPSP